MRTKIVQIIEQSKGLLKGSSPLPALLEDSESKAPFFINLLEKGISLLSKDALLFSLQNRRMKGGGF